MTCSNTKVALPVSLPYCLRALSLATVLALVSGCSPTLSDREVDPNPVAELAAPGCDALVLDVRKGHLNGLPPSAEQPVVQRQFPCSTGATEDGSAFNYGGGVFFIKHDFYVYTHRDFVEVRTRFRGRVEPNVLEMTPDQITAALGKPRTTGNIPGAMLYPTDYGCLRVEPGTHRHHNVAVHYESCDAVASWYRH